MANKLKKGKAFVWTENDVVELMAKRFAGPAWVLLRQVRNGTGYQRQTRTADVVAVSVWPSRGLFLDGVEVKVSRSDWRKELADPSKSESIQAYCRHWWVAAPKGVVPVEEVPETWGLIECYKTRSVVAKPAPSLDPIAPDMSFLASVLRNAAESMVPRREHVQALKAAKAHCRDAIKKAGEVPDLERKIERLEGGVKAFEEKSGVKIGDAWDGGRIGAAVHDVLRRKSADWTIGQLVRAAQNVVDEFGGEDQVGDKKATLSDRILTTGRKNEPRQANARRTSHRDRPR